MSGRSFGVFVNEKENIGGKVWGREDEAYGGFYGFSSLFLA